MQRFTITSFVTIILLLAGCGGGGGSDTSTTPTQALSCSTPDQNQFVHQLLLDRYLWYREVPASINYEDFDSPEQTLDFLKYADKDRFSYITDAQEFNALFSEGQYLGYGFSFFLDDAGRAWLQFVYADSAAGRAGLERGDEILAVDGETVAQISAALAWDTVFGSKTAGVTTTLQIRKKDGSTTDVTLEKAAVNINTVLYSSVIPQGSEKIGYLLFNSFLDTSVDELETVFADFKASGVTQVILDLRYNGGGSVAVARELGSLLFDNTAYNQLFTVLELNDKYSRDNSKLYFSTKANELDLTQLVVITTGSTASASEMIINGLKPFVPVKTIGSKTYGKPVGMNGVEFCDKIILPITFASYNANHEGDYFDGIPVDCAASDDVSYAIGDTADPMLAEALRATAGSGCSQGKPAHRPMSEPAAAPAVPSLQDIIGAV